MKLSDLFFPTQMITFLYHKACQQNDSTNFIYKQISNKISKTNLVKLYSICNRISYFLKSLNLFFFLFKVHTNKTTMLTETGSTYGARDKEPASSNIWKQAHTSVISTIQLFVVLFQNGSIKMSLVRCKCTHNFHVLFPRYHPLHNICLQSSQHPESCQITL